MDHYAIEELSGDEELRAYKLVEVIARLYVPVSLGTVQHPDADYFEQFTCREWDDPTAGEEPVDLL